jgi:predicted secreted protein
MDEWNARLTNFIQQIAESSETSRLVRNNFNTKFVLQKARMICCEESAIKHLKRQSVEAMKVADL